jgi:hypothetical protein
MRVISFLSLLTCLIFLPTVVHAKKATTIDELAAMYKVDECIDCHEDIYDEWKDSWHSKSLIDSRVIRTWRTFILSGLDKKGMPRHTLKVICLTCHAPQIKDATDEVAARIADLIVIAADDKDSSKREAAIKELSKININCLICHNLKALPDGKAEAGIVYGPRSLEEIDTSPHEESGIKTVKSDYLGEAKFCAECHHGCPPGMPSSICPTLWTSYQEHYLAHGGKKTCQDCHMEGEDYWAHKFPGVTEVEFAKRGIDLTLNASPTQYAYHLENKIVPAVIVNVQVKNTAGHGIPHG